MLTLEGNKISDAGMKSLAKLTGLQELTISDTAITDVGSGRLASLADLNVLALSDTEVSDIGLARLKGLTKLGRGLPGCVVDVQGQTEFIYSVAQ